MKTFILLPNYPKILKPIERKRLMELHYINFWVSLEIIWLGLGLFFCTIPSHTLKTIGRVMLITAANTGVVYLVTLRELNSPPLSEMIKLALYFAALGIDVYIVQDSRDDLGEKPSTRFVIFISAFSLVLGIISMSTMLYMIVSVVLPPL